MTLRVDLAGTAGSGVHDLVPSVVPAGVLCGVPVETVVAMEAGLEDQHLRTHVPALTTRSADSDELARRRPPGHGLGIDVEKGRNLPSGEQLFLRLRVQHDGYLQ
jgi:hypothetical protein